MANQFTVPTLRGIILRDDDDTLIVQANVQDIRTFAPRPGQDVHVQGARVAMRLRDGRFLQRREPDARDPEVVGRLDLNDFLYDRHGRPVARVTEAIGSVDTIDVTSFNDAHLQVMQGGYTLSIRAEGLPGVGIGNMPPTRRSRVG